MSPTTSPGITDSIGSQIGPIKTPLMVVTEEYIMPTVTK
jgi:hypothetical protein